jgi:alpha-L-rhamnosidase
LKSAEGKIPTPRGPVLVKWKNEAAFAISLKLPEGVSAKVELPASPGSRGVYQNGKALSATKAGSRWILEKEVSGTVTLEVK